MLLFYINSIMLNALFVKTCTASSRLESIKELSQKEAAEHCAMRGHSLWEYSDLTESSEAMEYLNDLDNGQSTWIEGRAIFSPFLNWIGCFRNDSSLRQYEYNTFQEEKRNMLYVCQHNCRYYYNGFIGVTSQSCFCFPWLLGRLRRVSLSTCDMRCSNFSFESCGGQNALSLYKRDIGHFSNAPRSSAGQCLFALNSVLFVYKPQATSCITSHNTTVHYICVQKTAQNCSNFADNLGEHCIFIKASASWFDAIKECKIRGGNLLFDPDIILSIDVYSLLQSCKICTYVWLGVYRTFLPTYKTDRLQDANACLSVRKLGETFYIETDNCSAKKFFRCKQRSSENFNVHNYNRNYKKKNMKATTVHISNGTGQGMATVTSSISTPRKNWHTSVSHTIMPKILSVESHSIMQITQSVNISVENNESSMSKNTPIFQIVFLTALVLNGIAILVVAVFCFKYRINRRQQRQATRSVCPAHGDNEPAIYASGDLRFEHTDANVTLDPHGHEYASIYELHDEMSLSNERSLPTHASAHLYEEFITSNDRYTYTDLEAADSCQQHQQQQEDTSH